MRNIHLDFMFQGSPYHAIVREDDRAVGKEYHIMVLDWELERLLYGNQFIRALDGFLHVDAIAQKSEQAELKLSIASSLSDYLNIPCFVGDSCLIRTSGDCTGWGHLHPIARHEDSEHCM